MIEFHLQINSDSGRLEDTNALLQWSRAYLESLNQTVRQEGKRDRSAPGRLASMMQAAGFEDIGHAIENIHMSPWSAGMCPI